MSEVVCLCDCSVAPVPQACFSFLGHGCALSREAHLGQVGVVSVVLEGGGLYAAMGFRCVCCVPVFASGSRIRQPCVS